MKKWSHVVVVFCLVLFALVWSAGIVPTLPNTSTAIVAQAAKVSLNITSKRIIKGKSFTLKVKGTTKIVTWKSDDKEIATVDADGVVTGKKKGKTFIRAKVGGNTYSCKVIVETPKISETALTLFKYDSYELIVKGTRQKVKWTSSNDDVAMVSGSGDYGECGYVLAFGAGTAKITAKVGGKKYTCKITVEDPKLSKDSLTLYAGNTYSLNLTGTTQKARWASSNTRVATVSQDGTVTAKAEGRATITAQVGSKTCRCYLTVKKDWSKVTATYYDTKKGIIAVIHNGSEECVKVTATVTYYDNKGNIVPAYTDSYFSIRNDSEETGVDIYSGDTVALKVAGPLSVVYFTGGSPFNTKTYKTFKCELDIRTSSLSKEEFEYKDVQLNAEKYNDEKLVVKVTNNGEKTKLTVPVMVLFFDASGKFIDYTTTHVECYRSESSGYVLVSYSTDKNYDPTVPDSFQAYIEVEGD